MRVAAGLGCLIANALWGGASCGGEEPPPQWADLRRAGLCVRSGGEVRCKFTVRVSDTRPGDSVVLLGKEQEVEGSSGEYLAKLETSQSDFPWWKTDIVVPVGERVEYKFAIRRASGEMTWKHPPNTLSFIFGDGSQANSDCSEPVESKARSDCATAMNAVREDESEADPDRAEPLKPLWGGHSETLVTRAAAAGTARENVVAGKDESEEAKPNFSPAVTRTLSSLWL